MKKLNNYFCYFVRRSLIKKYFVFLVIFVAFSATFLFSGAIFSSAYWINFSFDIQTINTELGQLEGSSTDFSVSFSPDFESEMYDIDEKFKYNIFTISKCNEYNEDWECIDSVPDLCPYFSITPNNEEGTEIGFVFSWPRAIGELNNSGDNIDKWKINIKSPCFEGECPADYNQIQNGAPLAQSLKGQTFKCDVFVDSSEPPVLIMNHWLPKVAYADTPSNKIEVSAVFTGEMATPLHNPVLIIPGVLGTEISDSSDKLWINLVKNITDFTDSFMDPLQFTTDLKPSDTNLVLNGVIRKIIIPFYNFDYTDGLITELKSQNYTEGSNSTDSIFTFPYDWRYGVTGVLDVVNGENITTVNLLKQKINEIKQQTGSAKVDIIAHSTGGLLLKKYVRDNQTDNSIGKAIFVGVPNTGAPQAIKTLLSGSTFGNPFLNPLEMKKIAKNMPVIYDLLPSGEYYNKKGSYVKVVDKNLLLNTTNIKDLNYIETNNFLVSDHNLNSQALNNAQNLHTADFDNFDLRTAGVDVYAIDGCKAGTLGKIIENRIHNTNSEEYFTSYNKPELTPGDGTVTLESATNLPINESNKYYALKADHSKMLSQDGIRQKIVNILSGSTTNISSELITQDISECKLNGKAISIYSPLDIDIVDNQGNHSGLLNGRIQNDIPNASFEIIDDHKFVYLPNDEGQTYTIKLQGTDEGTFTLKNEDISNSEVTETEVFSNIPVTTSLLGEVNLGGITTLDIDNGDGNMFTISPSAVIDANQSEDLISPVTTLETTGEQGQTSFYRSDVSISLEAIDPVITGQENKTSGILKTVYLLDDSDIQTYTTPIIVNTDGLHTLTFFSTDKAGNNESEQSITFTIDKKSPEPKISIDTTTKDLKIESNEIDIIISETSNTYTLTDKAGNTTKLFFQKKFLSKLLIYAKLVSIQYNNDDKITLPNSSFVYVWNVRNDPPILLSQTILVDKTYIIKAVYDVKKNQTTVYLKKKDTTIQKQIFTGLYTPKLTIDEGVVGYEL